MSRTKNRTNDQRAKNDHYATPVCSLKALFSIITFIGEIVDPCCGVGYVCAYLEHELGLRYRASDLETEGIWHKAIGGVDFLKSTEVVENLILTPPFRYADEFMEHAINLFTGQMAMLVRASFLHDKAWRAEFFRNNPPSLIICMNPRQPYQSGKGQWYLSDAQFAHVWVIWNKQDPNPQSKMVWVDIDRNDIFPKGIEKTPVLSRAPKKEKIEE